MKHLKEVTVAIVLLFSALITNAQSSPLVGLKNKLSIANNDTVKANILDSLSMYYLFYTDKYDNSDLFYDIPVHVYGLISSTYADGGDYDSALLYLQKMDSAVIVSKERAAKDISYFYWSFFYLDKMDYHRADSVIALGIASCEKSRDFLLKTFYLYRANSFFNQHRYKETITAARSALHGTYIADQISELQYMQASYYKLGNVDSAYFYLQASDSIKNVVENQSDIHETQQQEFNEELTKKEADAKNVLEKEKSRSKLIIYISLTALLFFLLFGFIQWKHNRQKQKANLLLEKQKQKVETTLSELKSTQAQLIQSEKMAGLGELTAGIAHEIQNPLNFVNNFSEVNKEMLEELKTERLKPNADKTLEDDLINNLIDNEEKINHHGKRADAIVKGMLQHSRQATGKKEPTDINALCDEYLRLSYHGLRAKDKNFNADFKTSFDASIGKINIVPQDIGRVLLNIINNAFYAVNEKRKSADTNYKPEVEIETANEKGKIIITICDNGNGIPSNIIDKIFQPFFTTKPTGSGTGLGLSLSYDILKAHSGEIAVKSTEREGSEFVISLPL